jgi:hypothetical protein
MSETDDLIAVRSRVAEAWGSLLARDLSDYPGDLSTLVEVASRNGKLRSMFPFLSVGRLCLSRCTDYPYFVPILIIPVVDGSFSVQVPVNRRGWVGGREIYRGSAEDAIRKADEALTGDDRRVLLGSAETLGL